MKIGIFSISQLTPGKHNVKDERLDKVDRITGSKKKTYVQMELAGEASLLESEAILALTDSRADLILTDLDFVEKRAGRSVDEKEKAVLNKLKAVLEKEEFLASAGLSPEEKQVITGYSLLTTKPIILIAEEELKDLGLVLSKALKESGYISFFTTGEKETRAWLIRRGMNAVEAAGQIHSDIQRGFIRAEIISYDDFIQFAGETPAKQAGKMRLEPKDYVMQDADIVNFRFNK